MRPPAARSATKREKGQPDNTVIAPRPKLRFAIAAALSGSAAVHAAPVPAADPGADTSLQEIVVTARKRAENLQDVPLSIDVYTAKDMQDLGISQFEDYATMTPSINFVSAGPGTQTFVMRGVSDGSNPNYSNAAATLFLVDDMSMNYYGVVPDLHLYDIERIEVLNGPQGTTFGAGAMAGALRFITNKPDPKAFSAGVDLDGGKIDGGTHNGVAEGFVNLPLIPDWTALRLSVYDDYHGGFIDNRLVNRLWVNGVVSNNAAWAGDDYNVEKVTGGRIALGQVIADGWKATLTSMYQRQLTHGAWDEDPTMGGALNLAGQQITPVTPLPENTVVRFGPEFKQYYTKTMDFHLDGDVGIGDLVFASTYWAQEDRWVNEYSEYMQYVNTSSLTASSRQAFDCLTDPISSGGTLPFSGCSAPTQYYDYRNNTKRWSDELRLSSKDGGIVHWLGGLYWERTLNPYANYYHMPGLKTSGAQWQSYAAYYHQTGLPPAPDDWYSYVARADYLQATEFGNVTFDVTPRLHLEAGTVHFHSHFDSGSYGGYWYSPQTPTYSTGESTKWNSKVDISYNATEHVLLYADAAQGFRDGGVNGGLPANCYKAGAPLKFVPDTLTNYELGYKTSMLSNHLVWDGAFYYMPWKDFQTLLFDPDICSAASFNANIGNARVYGTETNIKYLVTPEWSLEFSASYNDSHILTNSFENQYFQVTPGERLPYVPYLNYSGNVRYERPLNEAMKGYAQIDAAHKGDMWNDLQTNGSNGLPRVLQPGYTVTNLRMGLDETESHWLAEFYITNLTNKNAVIYTNEGNYDLRYTRNEPRVFGLRFTYRWGKPQAEAD